MLTMAFLLRLVARPSLRGAKRRSNPGQHAVVPGLLRALRALAMTLLLKILLPQFDRTAVRGAVGGAVPGVAGAREHRGAREALVRDEALERGEPVPVVGVAEVGIARRLRALDLLGECRRPLRPGEEAAPVERDRERERLRFPRLAEHRP